MTITRIITIIISKSNGSSNENNNNDNNSLQGRRVLLALKQPRDREVAGLRRLRPGRGLWLQKTMIHYNSVL